jgi:hypothetical protein
MIIVSSIIINGTIIVGASIIGVIIVSLNRQTVGAGSDDNR